MSHFYARIPISSRKTVPTARGHKTTGITVEALSLDSTISVCLYYDKASGRDVYVVHRVDPKGVLKVIAEGYMDENHELPLEYMR